ncbi:hypothetical protein G3N56_05345 [Desulfovibrio sulfodismutans]|uniref:Uncharacterized protein n=1 Tax=Desulfolutivibrio sulfodismutans TaxID=63561 RepID=A0A7K3NIY7_9BACT|nr:hypothetical protein [Desulfolutivibrio sulfodismutans]NDY56171.1 hypothetical protein [Desulfolutivibrio sulfodismutans]QLA12394.1 hypothetical protein GD606_08970 [Desulfolutivibrio sulfodismutans DSM 3696]
MDHITSLYPGSILIFFNKKHRFKPDHTGCNTIGIHIGDDTILHIENNKLKRTPYINIIGTYEKVEILFNEASEKSARILHYFTNNAYNIHLFNLGIHAIIHGINKILSSDLIMPRKQHSYSDKNFDQTWINFLSLLRPCDFIFTRTHGSTLSSIIANIDQGFWSHVGIYIGSNQIHEALTSGITIRNITAYKNKKYSIGIYRPIQIDDYQRILMLEKCRNTLGHGYNYLGALMLGLKTIFKIKSDTPTPNGIIYSGAVYPIYFL